MQQWADGVAFIFLLTFAMVQMVQWISQENRVKSGNRIKDALGIQYLNVLYHPMSHYDISYYV